MDLFIIIIWGCKIIIRELFFFNSVSRTTTTQQSNQNTKLNEIADNALQGRLINLQSLNNIPIRYIIDSCPGKNYL